MQSNDRKFIEFVIEDCKKYDVKVLLPKKKYLRIIEEQYFQVDGYFDHTCIKVATNKPVSEWVSILAHEYGHFIQYKTKTKKHKQYQKYSQDLINWSNGIITPKTETALKSSLYYEQECESFAVNLIKTYQLSKDLIDYTKAANLRLYAYAYEILTLKQYRDLPSDPKLYYLMPNEIIQDYTDIPADIKILFELNK